MSETLAFSFGFQCAGGAAREGFQRGVETIRRPMARPYAPLKICGPPLQLFFAGRRRGLNAVLSISRGLGGLPKPRSNKMQIAARRAASLLVFSMILTSSAPAAGVCCRACAGKDGLSL